MFFVKASAVKFSTVFFFFAKGCFLLLFGRLADIYGRKLIFLLGTMITGISSLACGFARTRAQIIFFRGLQGMGSAASVPAAVRKSNTNPRELELE